MYRRSSFVFDTIQHFGIQLCAQVPRADDVEGRGQHDDEAHESEDAGALRGLSEDAKEYTKKLISQGWNTPKALQREWVRRLSSQAGGGIPSVPDRSKLACFMSYYIKSTLIGAAALGGHVTPQRLHDYAQSHTRAALQGDDFDEHTVYIVGLDTFDFDSDATRFNLLYTSDILINFCKVAVYTSDLIHPNIKRLQRVKAL